MIYHTYNKQNEHGFAAKTIMGTFPYKEGNSHYTNINKFVTSNNKAIAEEKEIKKFIPLRNEKGTDIYILAPRDQIGFQEKSF